MIERWLPVPGWEGLYEVSDQAHVRSLPRQTATGLRGGKTLAAVVSNTGAHVVMLCDGGRKRYAQVYELVAEAFIGPRPPGQEIRHLDDNRLDSRLANIAYGTRSENLIDASRNGKHPRAKLTVEKVRVIRERRAKGETSPALAAEFGVSAVTIRSLHRNWRHVV